MTNLEKAKEEIISILKKYDINFYVDCSHGDMGAKHEIFLEEQFIIDGKYNDLRFDGWNE